MKRRKWVFTATLALLIVLLLACIRIGEKEPEVTPVPPTPTPVPPTATPVPPTPTPQPEAKPEIVSVSLCRGLTEDERPFAETNTFSELDPFVVSIQVSNLKPENIISARWYQDDAAIGLTEKDNLSGDGYVGLSLEPPGAWVPGSYKVEVSLDSEVANTQEFVVISMKSALPSGDGSGGGDGAPGEFALYRNDTLGFAIEYPSTWLVEEGDSSVEFAHPQDTALTLVLVNADPAGTSQQEAEAVFDTLSQNLPNVQLSSSQELEDDWYSIVFDYNNNGTDIIGILFSKVRGARGYNIVLLAVKDSWETVVPTFDQMLSSFQFSDEAGGGDQAGGEVLIAGIIQDSDTGRGIANALFVILKEGVTIQQFIDSGNDESLIYDMVSSDGDGAFTMNVPVKRGTTYAVFAVATGYNPVIDEITISEDTPDPWNVTVTMQKE